MTRHLIHIGYPKTGSKFLQRWFAAHPQLAYATDGLAGFRDPYSIARDAAVMQEQPRFRVTSCEDLSAPRPDSGKAAADYAQDRAVTVATAQERVCSTLAALFPNATVLIVTRGFRSMIFSSLSQYARSGGDVDLLQITARKERDPRFVQSFDYDRLIGAYRSAFGAENVFVMPYELLRDDADSFIRTLATRLGIEPVPAERERVNESLSPVEMYWYPRLTRVMRRIPSRRLFEIYIDAALRNRLRRPIALLQRLRPGTPLTAIPDELVDVFRGRAESLRGNPLYVPYASEYLL